MGTKSLLLAALGVCVTAAAATQHPANVQELIRRSVNAIEMDWNEAPNYTFVERDVESKHDGAPTVKTYQVLMIDGVPYNRLSAINDRPLTPGEQAEAQRKLEIETARREHESNRERNKRLAKYMKERNQDRAMLKAMADAFDFQLIGEETVNGHDCWVLNAKPKPGFQPTNRETKVLTGMTGKLWIDKATNQWVRVQAEVINPVNFYGFFAKVGPGTTFVLLPSPVGDKIWLPTRLSIRV